MMPEKLSLFSQIKFPTGLGEIDIPEHTKDALDNYFLKGYEPGSFLTGVLTNDLVRAVNSADMQNRHAIYEIVKWLITERNVPPGSWGCAENMVTWLKDIGGVRTKFVDKLEKEYIWEALKA